MTDEQKRQFMQIASNPMFDVYEQQARATFWLGMAIAIAAPIGLFVIGLSLCLT